MSKIRPHKGRFCDHSLPRLLTRLLTSLDHFKHLFLGYLFHLWQRHGEFGRLFRPLVFHYASQSLRVRSLGSFEETVRERRRGGFIGSSGPDIALFVRFDRFLHLDLLCVPPFLVEFRAEATQVLCILARGFGLSGMASLRSRSSWSNLGEVSIGE